MPTLKLSWCEKPELAPLLAALQPPAAGPPGALHLDSVFTPRNPAAAAAQLTSVRCLELRHSALDGTLEPLLLQLPNLTSLKMIVCFQCSNGALPTGPYLTGGCGQQTACTRGRQLTL